jgi:hypothetical protein
MRRMENSGEKYLRKFLPYLNKTPILFSRGKEESEKLKVL